MRLLSLFDFSGIWATPFADNGWDVICWDIKQDELCDINSIKLAETALDLFEDIDGILAAPPCTDFTVSGAQYWPEKDLNGTTAKAIQLVRQVQKLVNLFRPTDPDYDEPFFWAVENPVGRMQKLIPELGEPFYFNPCDFAGYLNPSVKVIRQLDAIRDRNKNFKPGDPLEKWIPVTEKENDLVVKWNAYTKRTGLWGEFNRDIIKKPIAPVRTAPQGSFTQRYGGKSEKTKEARSNTPFGFALAFYEANKDYKAHLVNPEL